MVNQKFYEVEIGAIHSETLNSSRIKLLIPKEHRKSFTYLPGQYITVKFYKRGCAYLRTYSISSSINESYLEIGVKHIENGAFSEFLKEKKEGDKLLVSSPSGNFCLKNTKQKKLLLIAAGSGITPIISIAKSILETNKLINIILLFSNKTYMDMMFKEDLRDLKDEYVNRFSLFNFFSREKQDVAFLNGRINKSKILFLNKKKIMDASSVDQIFICGPLKMAENVKKGLRELSVPELNIKTELFFTNQKKSKKQKVKVNKTNKSKVEILIDGTRRFLHMNTEDDFLDKASQAGINIPFSCKNGMCATCRCRVKEGKVRMKKNYSLEQWEIEQGFTLSCQLEPLDDNILLDFDVV